MKFDHEFRLQSVREITAAAAQDLPSYCSTISAARFQSRSEWSGNATYKEAVALAENGWSNAPRLGALADQIAPSETRLSHQMQHAVTGSFVDVSRYLEGHPENMLEFEDEPAPRQISIAINTGKNAMVTPRQMELQGAVALAVLDTLAASGFIVSASGFYAHEGRESGKKALVVYPIKRAAEPIDENQLAFWLCHPAAFRVLTFGFWDTCPRAFYKDLDQNSGRGFALKKTTAAEIGFDYLLKCEPSTEEDARAEYHRIISEITATL